MNSLCRHCEYGNRFIDLGQCPECETGRIVGDLHTRNIFCSNLHNITAVAVDFCGTKNCYEKDVFKSYEIIVNSELSHEQLIAVSNFTEQTPVQIYKSIKNGLPFCEKMDFYKTLKIGKYLYENNIDFKIKPDFPILYKFSECFSNFADDYQWYLKSLGTL